VAQRHQDHLLAVADADWDAEQHAVSDGNGIPLSYTEPQRLANTIDDGHPDADYDTDALTKRDGDA
jgi:hypothetical protein